VGWAWSGSRVGIGAPSVARAGGAVTPKDKRQQSAKHPRDFLKDVDDSVLKTAMIDRELLDYRSYRTFIKTRRVNLAKKLRELTDLSEKSFAFLDEETDVAAE
jgi:hypothetical protein